MIGLLLLFALAAGAADKPPVVTADPPPATAIAEKLPNALTPGKPVESFQSAMAKQRAAMVIQRESVRKQVELAAQWRGAEAARLAANTGSAGAETDAPDFDVGCDPLPEVELTPLIDGAAQGNQLQTKLLRGVIQQESANRPCAVSVKGAKGLMQLMPATMEQFQVDDPFDAKQNIAAGAQYLKQLLDRYKGDIKLALAAYNSGPAIVDKTGAIPEIKETRDYVEAIMKNLQ